MKKSFLLVKMSVLLLASCTQSRHTAIETQITNTDSVSVSTKMQTKPYIARNRDSVEVLFGYLKIFPKELGVFPTEPTSVINQINNQMQYGYNNWRIPTNEELTLLRGNDYLGEGEYMSNENKQGIVLLVSDGKDYKTIQTEELSKVKKNQDARTLHDTKEWVDLGLRSGTLWKSANEEGFYTYEQAMGKFGNHLPTQKQLAELATECTWEWHDNGYVVTGPSGKYIFLPASGYCYCNGDVYDVGTDGEYWSSTPEVTVNAMRLFFNRYGKGMGYNYQCRGRSVRLVSNR